MDKGFPDIFAVSKKRPGIGEHERNFRVSCQDVKILPDEITEFEIKRIKS